MGNIKTCKVTRKLDKGEMLSVLEGPIEDENSGVTRIRVETMKDKAEGWVTTKGNAGTTYARERGRSYIVLRAMPLQSVFESDAASTVRMLAEDESIEVTDSLKEEKSIETERMRVRNMVTGSTGWVTLRNKNLKPWSRIYKCVNATALHD